MKQSTMYYMIRGLMGLSFHMIFTAAGLYRIDIAQLQVYQLILIGTALEISTFVFEIPTGIIADLKSRRLSVIIGLFVIGIGSMIEVFTPFFYLIFIFLTTLLLVVGPFILQLIFASISLAISIFVTKSRQVMSVSLGLVIGLFFLDIISALTDNLNFLKYLTPYEYVNAVSIINHQTIELVYLLISVAMITISGLITWFFYNRKDITL